MALFCLVVPHLTASGLLLRPVATQRSSVAMQYGIPPGSWKVYPRDGDYGIIVTNYDLAPGQEQILGLYDIEEGRQNPEVAVEQAAVQVAPDGSHVTVYALGNNPTGWRTRPDEDWRWLQQGESQVLQSGWKVNLDCIYPESAVFKVEPCSTYPPYQVGKPKTQDYGMGEAMSGQGALPYGWVSGVDEQSGQIYYYNEQTGQSQWEPPF